MGSSRRLRPPTSRTTARLVPSGDQSAHCTCSSISRGAPPESGARARVPILTQAPMALLLSSTAISELARNRHQLRAAQTHGAGLRGLGPCGEYVDRISLPCRAVEDGLSVGSKTRGANASAAEGELPVDGWLGRRAGEKHFAGKQARCRGHQQGDGEDQAVRRFLYVTGGCRLRPQRLAPKRKIGAARTRPKCARNRSSV